MIDTHAVLAEVDALMGLTQDEQSSSPAAYLPWLAEQTQQIAATREQDAAGNLTITLPGKMSQTVVLGSDLADAGEQDRLASCVSLVVGVETLKALAQRYGAELPCGMQLQVWMQSAVPAASAGTNPNSGLGQSAAAYLELQVEAGSRMEEAGTSLGVADRVQGADVVFHPRLRALCDEAIRELTGTSAGLAVGSVGHASAVASRGVPAAVMCVQSLKGFGDGPGAEASRLHLLQAAEAFGRWAESTMHMVAGEEVDLWAREDRVPHLSSQAGSAGE